MSRCGGLAAALALVFAARTGAELRLPPAPKAYFNDEAQFVGEATAGRLEEKLRRFEQETGNQVVVAIFQKLPSDSLEDFTVRAAQAWRVGRKELDNGAVLFVFVQDRKLRLEVGYGLEEKIPDAIAKRIVDDVIVPRLRAGDPAGGLDAGIDAIVAAARGQEHPAAEGPAPGSQRRPAEKPSGFFWAMAAACYMVLLGGLGGGSRRSSTFTRKGREEGRPFSAGGCLTSLLAYAAFLLLLWFQDFSPDLKTVLFVVSLLVVLVTAVFPALARTGGSSGGWTSGGWSGHSWGGGGFSGGGGGGFSGGGGSFGGGGASGSW